MHTPLSASGHARTCPLRYDDLLLKQIIDVELDVWMDETGKGIDQPRGAYIDEVARCVYPQVQKELCIHQFVPNHLIALIRGALDTLLAS
jgi:hypothetical protein